MRKIDYGKYFDKVYGCFLGKTVAGTLGAPYEGVKMAPGLTYRADMIDTMLPNDDLDLQVLWLDVAEKYGAAFTSLDLLERFCTHCDYSPGEYAVMRKNYEKGIYPPYSGSFCNDFYKEGMGCVIRSEIWACLCPGDPVRAAELARRDGIIDHEGESVNSAMFFAAAEAEAFFCDDLHEIFRAGLSVIDPGCKFAQLIEYTLELCEKYDDIGDVLKRLLYRYGHPDCTNVFQNMGITTAALILGKYDLINTAMLALNCGHDTDCTCASAGALVGLVLGAEKMSELYGIGDVKYVLTVRSGREDDSVCTLSRDICALGCELSRSTVINAPARVYEFEKRQTELHISAEYEGEPAIHAGGECTVRLRVVNLTGDTKNLYISLDTPPPIKYNGSDIGLTLAPHGQTVIPLLFSVPDDAGVLYERNIITAHVGDRSISFGISGSKYWRVSGPHWRTQPPVSPGELDGRGGYFHLFSPFASDAEMNDAVRDFHLNCAADTETDFASVDSLFDGEGDGDFFAAHDSFRIDDFCSFASPAVFYLSQLLFSPEDMTVCVQLGYSSPFRFYVNGELIGQRTGCAVWDGENAHFCSVRLKKGENRIVLRLTRVNGDAKYSVVYSVGASCSAHYTCFGTKKF